MHFLPFFLAGALGRECGSEPERVPQNKGNHQSWGHSAGPCISHTSKIPMAVRGPCSKSERPDGYRVIPFLILREPASFSASKPKPRASQPRSETRSQARRVGDAFQSSPAMGPGMMAVVDCGGRLEASASSEGGSFGSTPSCFFLPPGASSYHYGR